MEARRLNEIEQRLKNIKLKKRFEDQQKCKCLVVRPVGVMYTRVSSRVIRRRRLV